MQGEETTTTVGELAMSKLGELKEKYLKISFFYSEVVCRKLRIPPKVGGEDFTPVEDPPLIVVEGEKRNGRNIDCKSIGVKAIIEDKIVTNLL